ncbi:hypothetical protein ON010_g8037 [Phytophthora cinnamomi]|nr:hypothetical protein ON010_g8037 [Phytophthora cinnamomi]
MPRVSFALVGTAGISLVGVDAPPAASMGEVSELLKAASPLEFRDIQASRIRIFKTGSRGNDILSDWEERHPDGNVGNALQPVIGTGGDQASVVQVVALIPVRKVTCAFWHTVFRIGINESATVTELKDEICNQMPGMFKLVKAKTRNLSLTRGDVRGRHSPQITKLLRVLAASDEVDTSCTVRAVFGDAAGRESIDLLVVPYEISIESINLSTAGVAQVSKGICAHIWWQSSDYGLIISTW